MPATATLADAEQFVKPQIIVCHPGFPDRTSQRPDNDQLPDEVQPV
jgi:hypothetical protein